MRARSRTLLAVFAVCCLGASQAACVEAQDEMHPQVAFAPPAASCGAEAPAGRLCGCVYDLPPGIMRLPDFAAFRPVEMLCVDSLDVGLRNGPPGFPGVTGRFEWFGVDFQGTITVAQPGAYGFRLTSDDGAKLYVDGSLVLNDDGRHDVRTVEGMVALGAGPHRIRVPYYDGPGPMALTLEVARPGEGYEILHADRPL